MLNSLVAYKGQDAKVIAQKDKKITILVADNELKVREKDIRFIHSEYQKPQNIDNYDLSILADLSEQALSLTELTQWLFPEDNAINAWQTFLLVEDKLYFYWQKDLVFIRSLEQVKKIKQKRQEEQLEEELQQQFIKNVEQNILCENDTKYLKEIEKVAFNQSKHNKILKRLNLDSSPEIAHNLLLKIGFWDEQKQPYLQRNKIYLNDLDGVVIADKQIREDLTHLKSYAIDDKNIKDADDAISIDGNKVWIHIVDVASFITEEIDEYIINRASTVYLPEQTIMMLPDFLMQQLPLGLKDISQTFTIEFEWCENSMQNIKIYPSNIKTINISYDEVDGQINTNKDFKKLHNIAIAHKKTREEAGAIQLNLPQVDVKYKDKKVVIKNNRDSLSREMILEFMVMAGNAVAKFTSVNEIILPFVIQDKCSFEFVEDAPLSQQFKMARKFSKSNITTTVKPHHGLGLNEYVRITSPLRRYLDLVAQQQILAFLNSEKMLDKNQVKQKIQKTNLILSNIRKASAQAQLHAKIVFFKQNPNWQDDATIIDIKADKVLFCIESLAIITQIKVKDITTFKIDEQQKLKVGNIDLINLELAFKLCND